MPFDRPFITRALRLLRAPESSGEKPNVWLIIAALFAFAVLSLTPNVGYPQSPTEDVEFAPGALGDFDPSFFEKLKDAEKQGEALGKRLTIQEPSQNLPDLDMNALRERALNNPRVKALLNADGDSATGESEAGDRWEGSQVWVLASFSMPKPSLRALLLQSQKYGVPVVFNGFVNNSVFETRDALLRVFGEGDDFEGFGIDPTLFTRFDVSSVPTFIAVRAPFDICETQGCEDDLPPEHDRVAGNIALPRALEIFSEGGGVAGEIARAVLDRGRQ